MVSVLRIAVITTFGWSVHMCSTAQPASPLATREVLELRQDKSVLFQAFEASGRVPKFDFAMEGRPDVGQLKSMRASSLQKLQASGALPRFEDLSIAIDDDATVARAKYELWMQSLVPDPVLLDQLRRGSGASLIKGSGKTDTSALIRQLMKKRDYVFMINAGTPVLGPLDPGKGGGGAGGPVPAVAWSVDKLWTGRLNEQFNPEGFLEVVALVNDSRDGNLCTGTLVAPDLVLTAAHCIAPGDAVTAVVHHEDADQRRRCEAAIARKEYIRCTRLKLVPIPHAQVTPHPQYKRGEQDHDIALLTFPTPFTDRRFARVNVANLFSTVTLAGYGRTDLPKAVNDVSQQNYLLEVGWHQGRTIPSGTVVSWYVSGVGDTQTGACEGDSGGPVYAGRWRGYEARPRFPELIGVVQGGIQSCSDYDSYQTAVAHESIKTWLCGELSQRGAPPCITAASLFRVGASGSTGVEK